MFLDQRLLDSPRKKKRGTRLNDFVGQALSDIQSSSFDTIPTKMLGSLSHQQSTQSLKFLIDNNPPERSSHASDSKAFYEILNSTLIHEGLGK